MLFFLKTIFLKLPLFLLYPDFMGLFWKHENCVQLAVVTDL